MKNETLSIVVVGASGDLARKKIFPAFFSLYCQGFLPAETRLFGFSRSAMTDDNFRERITEHLTCRYTPDASCGEKMTKFLQKCHYVQGEYDSRESFLDLYDRMRSYERRTDANRIYYLAIPPSVFMPVASAIGGAGLVMCGHTDPWSRVVVEKPFGKDRDSSDELTQSLAGIFSESQTFRIDHYLGKEVIQNLMVLRFANLVFEPLWNHRYVDAIEISWKEDIGIGGRAGYFDEYGIIRDVVQNHLLQVLALVTMEPPAKLDAAHVVNEKVRLLRQVKPLQVSDVVLGQYGAARWKGRDMPGYTEESGVQSGSVTPTFFSSELSIDNDRWRGTRIRLRAGKGLEKRATEIRIKFRDVDGNMFCTLSECPKANELLIRVQPDEGMYLTVTNKVPGLDLALETRPLNLQYEAAFDQVIPDAYESLLLDVLRGEKGLFIRKDELAAAWDVVTPLLTEIAGGNVPLLSYPFGSEGPGTETRCG